MHAINTQMDLRRSAAAESNLTGAGPLLTNINLGTAQHHRGDR
jgi:hypothetical protein